MTRTEMLNQLIEEAGGEVYNYELAQASSLVQKYEGEYSIAIDMQKVQSNSEYNRLLSHELGHIEANAFLNERCPFEPEGRVEYRAKKRSILRTFAIDRFEASLKFNLGNLYNVAEDFEATVEEAKEAMEYYRMKGLLAF